MWMRPGVMRGASVRTGYFWREKAMKKWLALLLSICMLATFVPTAMMEEALVDDEATIELDDAANAGEEAAGADAVGDDAVGDDDADAPGSDGEGANDDTATPVEAPAEEGNVFTLGGDGVTDTADSTDSLLVPEEEQLAEPIPKNGGILISDVSFPDENFREFVEEVYDTDGDGYLSDAERTATRTINAPEHCICDLTGVELLTGTVELNVNDNDIEGEVDLTALTKLKRVDVSGNYITALKLPASVQRVRCGNNWLTQLDLTGLTNLVNFGASSNQLTSLDVSGLSKLELLDVTDNQLTSLDVSKNQDLEELECGFNQITRLDISKCPNLITALKKGIRQDGEFGCPTLWYEKEDYWLSFDETLDTLIADQTYLGITEERFPDDNFREYVEGLYDLDENGLLSDEERCGEIYACHITGKGITDLTGIEVLTGLEELSAENCNLSGTLDLTCLTNLGNLFIYNNNLTEIKLPMGIGNVRAQNNALTKLDLTGRNQLYYINVSNNALTTLDVSGCTRLELLNVTNNQLTRLNVSNCTIIEELECGHNNIAEIDISRCPNLIKALNQGDRRDAEFDCPTYCYEPKDYWLSFDETTLVITQPIVRITENNFPDPALRAYVENEYDTNHDGALTDDERAAGRELNAKARGIQDLTGIELLTGLKVLMMNGIQPANGVLNLTALTNLERLCVEDCGLTSLQLPKSLHVLECDDNELTSLDLSGFTALEFAFLNGNPLTSLTLTKCAKLKGLFVARTNLKSLTISDCTQLKKALNTSRRYQLEEDAFLYQYVDSKDAKNNSELCVPTDLTTSPATTNKNYPTILKLTAEQMPLTIDKGKAVQLLPDGSGRLIEGFDIESGTDDVISVDDNGVLSALCMGTDTVFVDFSDGWQVALAVTVNDSNAVIKPTEMALTIDGEEVDEVEYDLKDGVPANVTLGLSLKPAGAKDTVSWASTNTNVATVKNGLVQFKEKVGEATVTATSTLDNTVSASVTFVIVDTRIPEEESYNFPFDLGIDDNGLLEWNINDLGKVVNLGPMEVNDGADNTTAFTTSASTSVATLDKATGELTFKGTGARTEVVVTATSKWYTSSRPDLKKTVSVRFIDDSIPDSLLFDTGADLEKNDKGQILWDINDGNTLEFGEYLYAEPDTASTEATWSVNKSNLATIDPDNGTITFNDKGNTGVVTVTATSTRNKSAVAKADILISDSTIPTAVTINEPQLEMEGGVYVFDATAEGAELTLTAEAINAMGAVIPGDVVTWSSNAKAIADIDESTGRVLPTLNKFGTVTFTATAIKNKKLKKPTVRIKIIDGKVPQAIEFTNVEFEGKTSCTVDMGKTPNLLAECVMLPAETADQGVMWSGNKDSVATIDEETGWITFHSTGTVTFTAASTYPNCRLKKTIKVTVEDSTKPKKIAIIEKKPTIDLATSGSTTLNLDLGAANAIDTITWETSSDLVTLNENDDGKSCEVVSNVQPGDKLGSVTITATSAKLNKKATVKVTITDSRTPKTFKLSMKPTSTLDFHDTRTINVTATGTAGLVSGEAVWKLNDGDDAIATLEVSADKKSCIVKPTGKKEGTVTVTATSVYGGKVASIKVKVEDLCAPKTVALKATPKTTFNLGTDAVITITATVTAKDSKRTAITDVDWSFSDPDIVAKVEEQKDGTNKFILKIKPGKKKGTCKVTVTTRGNVTKPVTKTINITVK